MSDNAAPPQEHPAATDTTEPEATEVPPSPQGHNSGRISPGNEAGGEEGFVENGSSRDESPDRENYDRDAYGRDRYGQGYDDYDDNDEDEDHYNDHSMEDDGYDDGHEQGYNNHQSMHGYDEDNFRGRMKAEREYADDGYQSRPHNHRVDDSSDNNEKHEKEDQSRRVALANARQRDEFGRFVPGPGKRKAQNQGASDDPTAVVPPKQRKKPGPKPRNPQPLKNDIQAKKLIIRQIEAHWGKDFIKNFIPKVHRPLVKRKKGKARTHNRKHEDDPMKWLPSILKAILSLARLIDDKARLKKVMGDVVRYRNQHTGNKKPQLVTTDFDVIEDIIERGWSVKQSFDIRYKHLLTNRMIAGELDTNSKEQKEYYDHLFRNESDGSSSEEEVVQAYGEDDGDGYGDGADEDMEYELTNDYQLQSGYYDSPPQKPQPPPRQQKSGPPPGYRQPPPRPNPEPARGYRPSSSSQYHRESSPVYRQAPSKQYPPEPVRDYRAPPAPMVRPPPTQGYRKPAPRYDPEDRFELENSFEPSERFMPPGTPRRNEQIRRPEPSRRPPVPGYRGYDAPYNTPDSYNSRGYPMTNRGDFEGMVFHESCISKLY